MAESIKQKKDGWVFIQDLQHRSATPDPTEAPANSLLVQAATKTLIPNDAAGPISGLGAGTSERSTWWDSVNYALTPSKENDFFSVRLNFTLEAVVNNQTVTTTVDIGTGNTIWQRDFEITRGAGVAVEVTEEIALFVGSGPIVNGGFFFNIKSANQVRIFNISHLIRREFRE